MKITNNEKSKAKILKMLETLDVNDLYEINKEIKSISNDKYKIDMDRMELNAELDGFIKRVKGERPTTCPICGFSGTIVKNGHQTKSQRFLCKNCNCTFGYNYNTILKGSDWSSDMWITAIHYFCNHTSFEHITDFIIDKYKLKENELNIKTTFYNLHKFLELIKYIPLNSIDGKIVQIDETLFPECQKGQVTELINYNTGGTRQPRHKIKSRIKGSRTKDFSYVETAVDEKGNCVCMFMGLGGVSAPKLVTYFQELLKNPDYLCSDADRQYEYLCEKKQLNHYERPSTYLDNVKGKKPSEIEDLYEEGKLDKVILKDTNKPMDYVEMSDLKREKELNISRVNALHTDLKNIFMERKKNVSTKYLASYMAFYTYLKNYKLRKNTNSITLYDAKCILIELLKYEEITYTNRKEIQEIELEEPSVDIEIEKEYQEYISKKKVEIDESKEFIEALNLNHLRRVCKELKKIRCTNWNKEACINFIKSRDDYDDIIVSIYEGAYLVESEKEEFEKMKKQYKILRRITGKESTPL